MPFHTTANGDKLHYRVHGEGGTAILMLHGLSQSGRTFNGMLEALTADRQVIVCDLPGHGESYRPSAYHAEQMVEDVASLLHAITDEAVVVYGHSLGSLIGTGLAAQYPKSVSKLILSDPPLVVWDAPRWKNSIISSYFGWARKILQGNLAEGQIIPMLQSAFPHRSADVLREQATALTQLDIAIINALFDDELTTLEEVLSQYEKLQCPTLVLQADPKILAAANDDDVAAIQARAPQAQHIKFSGADHDLHIWNRDKVLTAVNEFLSN
ncbi:MAG: alpha/beta hydrolase [Salinisphaeraceae bacterium]|nr:alpha/beta hydrolase [Salinisphaeraceae bacterium]